MQVPPTLLIVDDEPLLLELLEDQLSQDFKSIGIRILTAPNGKVAFDLVMAATPEAPIDAVLSDLMMPELSGIAFMEKTRALGSEIPFVFLTGFGNRENIAEALRIGATDFLDKPFNRTSLKNAVQRALDYGLVLRDLERELRELEARTPIDPSLLKDQARISRFRFAQRAVLLLRMLNKASKREAA